jgi:hypothetical protein
MAGTTGLEPAASAVTVQGRRFKRKGLEIKPFFLLAPNGTERNTQALHGKKN